ncbi:cell death activator CIDE-A [Eurytemora carolleeae]|uniref:cell death activator CIDE-A n=1 Tax=Eurytemora carolleeae TaxID=1294199 RepID=UPI000C78812B|nr:cell death activator CIDE-A [Eurytemora carolleeae]|eukprot:XP_023346892.1 cell death activator CIDE-A-like [Eurytemora affinis]
MNKPGQNKMSGMTRNRPVLMRAETIDSCCSDDLVTVLEVARGKRPFKITDRLRILRKGVMAASLQELIQKGKERFEYETYAEVYIVLEEDGTEVDEEEYFQTLPDNTNFMLLLKDDIWSPFGPPFM